MIKKELKFKAVMGKHNTTMIFTFRDMLEDRFSNRVLLIPWLKNGGIPTIVD